MCVTSKCEAKQLASSEGQRSSGAFITPCLQLFQFKISEVFPSYFAFLNNMMVPSLDRITLRDIFLHFTLYFYQTTIFIKYQTAIFLVTYTIYPSYLSDKSQFFVRTLYTWIFSFTQISSSQISPSQCASVLKQFCHALTHSFVMAWFVMNISFNSCQGLTDRADLLFFFFPGTVNFLGFITLIQSTSPNPSLHLCQNLGFTAA